VVTPAISAAIFSAFALFMLAASPVKAQEAELTVVDEVIAQVNEDVITLSMLKRESKERIETLKQNGMTEQQATEEVAKRKAELIATLINERLLLQKGKELELATDVEAEVNRRMLDVAKEQGITTIEKLDQAMKESGLDPVMTRQTLRNERHIVMDATRLDQFGFWSGWIRYDGRELKVDGRTTFGLKDRSWGIRPVGDAYTGGAPLAEFQALHFC
jgi:parvulin-like peptidyl-prolyl isomerase